MDEAVIISITQLQRKHVATVIELAANSPELRTGNGNAAFFWEPSTLIKWSESELGVLLVASKQHDEVVGAIICGYNPISRDAYIHAIMVIPKHRAVGIGSQLIARAEETVAMRGCNHIFALVHPSNESSINLFKRTGYDRGNMFFYYEKTLKAIQRSDDL